MPDSTPSIREFTRVVVTLVIALLMTGCGLTRREQLEQVAKDWCETIRASQVIAVYPLTQDMQPGDVFLVQTTIDQQQRTYRKRGFLPLDNHLARLHPRGYVDFYDHSFLDSSSKATLPTEWLKTAWQTAPSAAFPSYAFSATSAGGLNLAIPVSGVPVGLSLLGTQSANGTISLKDARTIGIDTASLYGELSDWANKPERQRFLAPYGVEAKARPRNFLRVVTRVYLLGAIDVQLNDARSFGGGLDVGAARPVELFLPETPQGPGDVRRAGQETYLRGVQRLNAMSGTGVPLSSEGADPSLSSDQFDARQRARVAARETELERAKKEDADADKALADAKTAAAQSPEGQALEQARTELVAARTARDDKAKRLRELEAAAPRDQAAIDQAKAALDLAEQDVAAKEAVLKEKLRAFAEKHDATLQEAAGKADITQGALDRLQGFAPGASLRFTAASARSISMSETFKVPLVIGYLGFDVPIGTGGHLGAPIPTHALLNDPYAIVPNAANREFETYATATYQNLYSALAALAKDNDGAKQDLQAIDARIARFVPKQWPQFRVLPNGDEELKETARTSEPANLATYLVYDTERKRAIARLDAAVAEQRTVKIAGNDQSGEALRARAQKLAPADDEKAAYEAALAQLRESLRSF